MAVDPDLRAVVTKHRHHLEKVPGPVRTEIEDLAVLLLTRRQRVFDGVPDVLVADPVLAGRIR
jgi:hypothetical protein